VFEEYGGRVDRYASYLYSLIIELSSNPVLGSSIKRFVTKVCRDVSLNMLGYNTIPDVLPVSFDELLDHMFRAVMEWADSNKEKIVLRDRVVPKRESVEEYARMKTLEIISTCFERSLTVIGVVE